MYCYLLFHVANAFLLLPRSRCYYDYLFIYANAAVDNGNVAADAARCLRMRTARVGRQEDKERERELALTRLVRINKTVLTVWSEHKIDYFIYLSLKKVL